MSKLGFSVIVKLTPPGGSETTIAKVISAMPPAPEFDEVDRTNHDSANGYREFGPGLADAGEVEVELFHEPGSASDLLIEGNLGVDGAELSVELPKESDETTGKTYTMAGFIKSYEIDPPMDDDQKATFTFRVSGKPTIAEAASA